MKDHSSSSALAKKISDTIIFSTIFGFFSENKRAKVDPHEPPWMIAFFIPCKSKILLASLRILFTLLPSIFPTGSDLPQPL